MPDQITTLGYLEILVMVVLTAWTLHLSQRIKMLEHDKCDHQWTPDELGHSGTVQLWRCEHCGERKNRYGKRLHTEWK